MKRLAPSLSDLLARLTQLEERTNRAEERAAKAEARAAQLENATGNLAAAMVNPKSISRRNLLMKVAGVGAAGVAGSLILNRKDAHAAFTWGGGAANTADLETFVTAASGFTNPAVLSLDANAAANPTTPTDGLRTYGSGYFSGIAAYGGNASGASYYGYGGNAAANVTASGPMLRGGAGANQPGGGSYAAELFGHGASDGTAFGNGIYLFADGRGRALVATGGGGTTATPHINGGSAILAYGGPGTTSVFAFGDGLNRNPAIPAYGITSFGNSLGVGGLFAGGRAQVQIIPNGGTGAPTTGPHYRGDLYMDTNEVIWVCIATGTPGAFAPLQPGGMNIALFTAMSTAQSSLVNSDGATWVAMDSSNLKLVINPPYNCQAILTANADLWTTVANFNQDIGISISGGIYPTAAGQPEAWKESGGPGTYSPNAAYLQTVVPLAVGGGPYTIQIVWKTNHGGNSTIWAGAGPINGKFSATRLTAQLVPTNPGGLIPLKPEVPFTREPLPQLLAPGKDPYGRK